MSFDNSYLFFKIFRNLYIRNKIYYYLELSNKWYKTTISISIEAELKLVSKLQQSFIEKIIYCSESNILDVNCLPRYGTLKTLVFKGLPKQTIEPLDKLPSSIETIKYPVHNTEQQVDLPNIKSFKNLCFQSTLLISIPDTVEQLSFSNSFNQVLTRGILPSSLTSLNFGNTWNNDNKQLGAEVIPCSVHTLNLGLYNQIQEYEIPLSVTNLTISFKSIDTNAPSLYQVLPKSIRTLTILNSFSLEITKSTFGIDEEMKFETLIIKNCGSLLIEINSIPSSVTTLKIKNCKSIHNIYKNMLPGNLKAFKIDARNEQFKLLNGSLPQSLMELDCKEYGLSNNNDIFLQGFFPLKLRYLHLGCQFKNFNKPISTLHSLFPDSLYQVNFGRIFNKQISTLNIFSANTQIKSIIFGEFWNQPLLENTIPKTVEKIVFSPRFNQKLTPGSLPLSLKDVSFGCKFNQKLIVGSIPCNVECLIIGKKGYRLMETPKFNQFLNQVGILPSSLKYLELNCPNCDYPLDHTLLPKSIHTIKLSDNFKIKTKSLV